MAARSIASLSLSFGLVSIPIKLYSATETSSAIKFKLMAPGGARVRQIYVADALPVEAAEPESAPAPEPAPSRAKGAARAEAASVVDMPARAAPRAFTSESVELEAPVSRSDMFRATSSRGDSSSSSRPRS